MKYYFTTFLSKIFLTALAICGAYAGQSQSINSTYSRFGLGVLPAQAGARSLGMGGFQAALTDASAINAFNPASYSFLENTLLQFTGEAHLMQASTDTESLKYKNGLISEMSMALRKPGKPLGIAFGLHPYSRVGYTVSNYQAVNDSVNVNYTYTGKGGLNEAFVGASYLFTLWQTKISVDVTGKADTVRMPHNLSIGVNMNYLFGSTTHTAVADIEQLNYYNSRLTKTTFMSSRIVKGNPWQVGIIYVMPLQIKQVAKKTIASKYLNVGLTYQMGQDLRGTLSATADSYFYETDPADTSVTITGAKINVIIPQSFTAGLGFKSFHHKRGIWQIGAQATIQNWSQYSIRDEAGTSLDAQLTDALGVNIGIDYKPISDGGDNLLHRMSYRAGAAWQQTHLTLNKEHIMRKSVSAGLSIPLLKSESRMHVAVENSSLGTTLNGLVLERQTTIWLGFTLAPLRGKERWFHTYQYD
ncbi:MAG: hypothetical protein ACKVOR_10145 [Flavobacteriales bacterium]